MFPGCTIPPSPTHIHKGHSRSVSPIPHHGHSRPVSPKTHYDPSRPVSPQPHHGHSRPVSPQPHHGNSRPVSPNTHYGHSRPVSPQPHHGHSRPVSPKPHHDHLQDCSQSYYNQKNTIEDILGPHDNVIVTGNSEAVFFEVKSIEGASEGAILMSVECHFRICQGWPEERFTLKHTDGSLALELTGESVGCCACDLEKNTEVRIPNGNTIGYMKGTHNSGFQLLTPSDDVLGKVEGGGFFASDERAISLMDGELRGQMIFRNLSKFLILFPDHCPINGKILIVATALEVLWAEIKQIQSQKGKF